MQQRVPQSTGAFTQFGSVDAPPHWRNGTHTVAQYAGSHADAAAETIPDPKDPDPDPKDPDPKDPDPLAMRKRSSKSVPG